MSYFQRLIIIIAAVLMLSQVAVSQTVPVKFHFKPTFTDFSVLRMVGTHNGWNNSDDEMIMTDSDGDGEYDITIDLPVDITQMYKFVMDADWELAWTDPDNPNINVSDNNNSTIRPDDPMITYLLPRDKNSRDEVLIDTSEVGLPIRAILSYTDDNAPDLSTLRVTIDNVEIDNPLQYYDEAEKEFFYQPSPPLSTGDHTIALSFPSSQGFRVRTSKFHRDPDYVIYEIPIDFYYDSNSRRIAFTLDLDEVSLMGTFNNWNSNFDPLYDTDGDGVWEITKLLEEGYYEHKLQLNKFFWVHDPDNPVYSETNNDNHALTVTADSIPSIKLISPSEFNGYDQEENNITLTVLLRPGVKSDGIDETTIKVIYEETEFDYVFDDAKSTIESQLNIAGNGAHTISVSFSNMEGLEVSESYTYSVHKGETGVYFADAIDDELYSYPAGTDEGSCDILSVAIDETMNHDSLLFTVEMEQISDETRIALLIANPASGFSIAPSELELVTPEWNNEGVYASIGKPGNSLENTDVENRFMENRDPVLIGDELIDLNDESLLNNRFQIKVSLAYLDSLMGGWTRTREFYIFSYLAASDGSGNAYEVTAADGGSDDIEDPDVYDAAFIRSSFWQNKILSNYIPETGINGRRFAALDGYGRGIMPLLAEHISDSLASFGPVITFLTPAVSYWYSDITVKGELSDSSITSVLFFYNDEDSVIVPVSDAQFSVPVTLLEGENTVYIIATDAKNFTTISDELILIYEPDYNPTVTINGTLDGRSMTLTAEAESPKGLALYYYWTEDPDNPASISLSSGTSTVTRSLPNVNGEYFFNARVTDIEGRRVWARIQVNVSGDQIEFAGLEEHANWIDKAIVYEIYPRSFSDQGGFQGVKDKVLDMLDLGINTIWFMPTYKSPEDHGYDIIDYYDFEEDYGTEEDFIEMLDVLKEYKIRVILDFVVNHTAVQHPFMQTTFEYRGNSPWADWYIWEGEPGNSAYQFLFDWATLPNLNHNNEDVRKYFINVAKHWINTYNIDGYRCDVAWGVEERNNQFWLDWRKELKNIKPEVFLEAEASSSDAVYYDNRFDSANDWDLRNKLLGALSRTVSITELDAELRKPYPDNARPFRFVENHDEVRVASSHGTQKSKLAHTILFTANGIPLIYSGGEVGEETRRNMIDWSDPDGLRTYFKRLTRIRKKYILNPQLGRIINSQPQDVYTYSSTKSGFEEIITAANFSDEQKLFTMNLPRILSENDSTIYYMTNLIDGTVHEIPIAEVENYEYSLEPYEAKIFYWGLDSVLVSVDEEAPLQIKDYSLMQNYPNPFNPSTMIRYEVPETQEVTLTVYDVLGRKVATLVNEVKNAGRYNVKFNASHLSSGVYFYRLKAGNFIQVKKLMLMK